MKLDEVFKAGHAVAMARNPLRRAVQVKSPAERAGIWLVAPAAVAGLPAKKKVDPGDVLGRVDVEGDWEPDHAHCWCAKCAENRRLSQTHDD